MELTEGLLSRHEQEEREQVWLAPYACRASETLGRRYPEDEHAYRTAFQRDKDRVIHSAAFRRLEYKTQVFVTHVGDYYRTRLTHSLEVSQIARTLGRVLRLNEDLIEAISLAHDLGHTPFGHSGEGVLNELMKDVGGFEHNAQALRVVDLLEERYPLFPGLNLTAEVRRGILKRKQPFHGEGEGIAPFLSLEAQVVDTADEIAYNSHDCDDGIKSELITSEELESLPLWRDIVEGVSTDFPGLDATRRRASAVVRLINAQVSDVARECIHRIQTMSLSSPHELNCEATPVGYSREMVELNRQLKQFLQERLYRHPDVLRATQKSARIMSRLFEHYVEHADHLPRNYQSRIDKDGAKRTVADYLAGMTDRFAAEDYRQVFLPSFTF
ncbi:MAG: deoxyguanosinetriphosphate triphosphohydrolase [bacterium]